MGDDTDDKAIRFDEESNEEGAIVKSPIVFDTITNKEGGDDPETLRFRTSADFSQAMGNKVLWLLAGAGIFLLLLILSLFYVGEISMIEGLFGSITTLIGTIAGYMLRSLKA